MEKIELLAPAKDLAKAKIAIMYGADAVYIGGKSFSLRSRASNFEMKDIEELCAFARSYGRKVYVTVNMIFHDEDLYGIREYLKQLGEAGVNAVIISSLSLIPIIRNVAPDMEAHISTQLSTSNSSAVNMMKSFGAQRVVLSRETSMDEIEEISRRTDVPLEVFIHGGMCSNYSGRCVLSNRMTLRDANRGGCAHSCRWKYKLYDGDKLISKDDCLLSMSSKDLRAHNYIERMIKCGVSSLKIEGRMKSEYYIAQVVKTYRDMIDEIYETGHLDAARLEYYANELDKAENRPSDDGFLSGKCDEDKHLFGVNGAGVTHDYVAYVHNYDEKRSLALIEVKNIFKAGDELEAFGPGLNNSTFMATLMFDVDWKRVELANKPTQMLYIRVPFKLKKHDMIRKAQNQ